VGLGDVSASGLAASVGTGAGDAGTAWAAFSHVSELRANGSHAGATPPFNQTSEPGPRPNRNKPAAATATSAAAAARTRRCDILRPLPHG
jgi:hypothetical protein